MFEIDKEKFGTFIAALRREQGYTQKELAEKLFLSDKAVSKWETGASIPDTALLVPLSQLLGVSVTELLLCERREQTAPLDAAQVEDVVKTALVYSEEQPSRAYGSKSKWPALYLLSAAAGLAGMLLNLHLQLGSEPLLVTTLLALIFGAYFCFFVKTKLPAFYDENRCGFYSDGVFRMNIPGVAFTNANWPHIVRAVRLWACLCLALFPVINIAMNLLCAEFWQQAELFVYLLLSLGGLFLPVYLVARKYE